MNIQTNIQLPRLAKKSQPIISLRNEAICHFLQELACQVFCQTLDEIRAKSRRSAKTAFARQVIMYVAHTTFGLQYIEIADVFDRDRTTVSHACKVVEDRRDEPSIDLLVCCVERAALEWRSSQEQLLAMELCLDTLSLG